MAETFIACSSCGCHAKSHETDCPHCGARMRRWDGTVPRTAAALLLGLSAVTMPLATVPACGSDVESGGAGGAGGEGAGNPTNTGGHGGHGGMATSSSFAAAYGGGGTISTSSFADAYGVALTDADGDGYIDASMGGDDCDDMNADIHPGALEKPGDGVDSNCDGDDDT